MRHCHVVLRYLDPGSAGLMAGLVLLHRAGELRLTQAAETTPPTAPDAPWHIRNKEESSLQLFVDGRSAYVDIHDSWEIEPREYQRFDVYFKRSYDPVRFPPADYPKLRPLGLVKDVRLDGFDTWEARRILAQKVPAKQRAAELLRHLTYCAATLVDRGPRPNISLMESAPEPAAEPRVLFMAGVWDPAEVPESEPGKRREFEAINVMRAECVRHLRRAFGPRFFGGIQHTAFARRECPDVLLPDARLASKRAYIRRVRHYPVCIATTGLHGSNGWKLAEYVGFSRAIVSERLHYAVPGEFRAPANYLEFDDAASCVEQVGRLLDDAALRAAQMQENWAYYTRWMRPDALARYVVDQMGH